VDHAAPTRDPNCSAVLKSHSDFSASTRRQGASNRICLSRQSANSGKKDQEQIQHKERAATKPLSDFSASMRRRGASNRTRLSRQSANGRKEDQEQIQREECAMTKPLSDFNISDALVASER
jgi:hypothetical protein